MKIHMLGSTRLCSLVTETGRHHLGGLLPCSSWRVCFLKKTSAFSFLVGAMSIIALCLSPAGGSILVLGVCPAAERCCLLGAFTRLVPQLLWLLPGVPLRLLALVTSGAYVCRAHRTVTNRERLLEQLPSQGHSQRQQSQEAQSRPIYHHSLRSKLLIKHMSGG